MVEEEIANVVRELDILHREILEKREVLNRGELVQKEEEQLKVELNHLSQWEEYWMKEKEHLRKREELILVSQAEERSAKIRQEEEERKARIRQEREGSERSPPKKKRHVVSFHAKVIKSLATSHVPKVGECVKVNGGAEGVGESQMIYRRKCYDILEREINSVINEQKKKRKSTHILILGTPGIGKSAFLLLLLQKFLNEGKKIGYCSKLKDDLVAKGEDVWEGSTNDVSVNVEFIDGVDTANAHPPISIMVSSPRRKTYSNFEKSSTCTYYMPPWEWEEIKECNQMVYEKDEKEIRDLYSLWGGCARYIFDFSEEQSETQWNKAVNRARGKTLKSMMSVLNSGAGDNEDSFIDRLFHMIPEEDMKTYTLRFASSLVSEAIVNVYYEQLLKKELKMITELGNVPNAAALRGTLFEDLCHRRFVDIEYVNRTFKWRSLERDGEVEDYKIDESLKRERFWDLNDVKAEPGIYYRPLKDNLSAGDSFLLKNDDELHVFQMTVSKKHAIKQKGLRDIIARYMEGVNVKFIFVVPNSIYNSYKRQPFHNLDGKETKRYLKEIESVEQYVLCIPFDLENWKREEPVE